MALRIAATVFVLGALAMWLVVPIGNSCPDLGKLPPGSTSSSSPSFSPPLTRTCTYKTVDGTEARSRFVPWLGWALLLVVAGVAGTAARFAAPSEPRAPRGPRAPRAPRGPRPERAPRPERPPRAPRAPRAERRPDSAERDAAARERARQERAERARQRRGS